jgi:signal transduction histidine kinase
MNQEKKALLDKTYQDFMMIGFNLTNMDKLGQIVSSDIMGFGTAADERFFSLAQLQHILKVQENQSAGVHINWESTPLHRHISSDENSAVYVDDVRLKIDTGTDTLNMDLRFSVVLEYLDERWLVVHGHGSKPEDVQSNVDTFGINVWKQKAEELEKLVQEKTKDLITKNRELEIEAALERVRSSTMAMLKSDDLLKIIVVVKDQLINLGFSFDDVGFGSMPDEGGLEVWMAVKARDFAIKESAPHSGNMFEQGIRGAHKNNTTFLTDVLPQQEMNDWLLHLVNKAGVKFPPEILNYLLNKPGFARSVAMLQGIFMYIGNYSALPYTDKENEIFKRFAAVFEQSYIRFLDLQKAEAQARESQIEAALERVRSRTMAMHKSTELNDAAELLYQELTKLGIEKLTCGYTLLDDAGRGTCYMANPQGNFSWEPFYLDHLGSPAFNSMYISWKKQQPYSLIELSGEKNIKHNRYLAEHADNFPMPVDLLLSILPPTTYSNSFNFRHGYLLVVSLTPISKSQSDIILRFTKVFEQTYTRFLDLQKAEEQALRAEQDLIVIKEARKRAEETLVELQVTQKQLIQSEKMASLGELTAGIAHEIQNPLNFVNNFSEISNELIDEMNEELNKGDIIEAKAIADDIKQNLEKINHHGKRADAIVKGMLQHSRMSSGQKELTDINALCDEYLRLAYHGLRAKDKAFNADFKTNFDPELSEINIVPQDIGRVMLNIINNAFYAVYVKKTTAGKAYAPTVTITTTAIKSPSGDLGAKITIKDNGNGISEKIRDKIFQPFFTTKPTGSGTGLGLSLSYDIVKAHGGEIKVESKEGEWTEFTIQLPFV